MKLSAILFTVICPGCGHISLGLARRGLLLLFCFAAFLAATILANTMLVGAMAARLFVAGICLSAFVWLVALIDLLRIGRRIKEDMGKFVLEAPGVETHPSSLYREGRVSYLKGEFEKARKFFRRSLEKDPADIDALYQLARVNLELRDMDAARELFNRYLKQEKGVKWRMEAENCLKDICV